MTPPPANLDGDPVVRYAVFGPHISPSGMTRHLVDGKFMSGIAALAITRSGGESGYDLCYCNDDWGVLARSSHASLEAALQHTGATVFEKPVARRPTADHFDHPRHVQALGLTEGQGLGDRLVDAGGHDLIHRLSGLTRTDRTHVGDRAGSAGQGGTQSIQGGLITAGHH